MSRFASESIAAGGYDPARARLRLRFTTGGTYEYADVPPEIWDGLQQAESKGRYFHDRILELYRYHRVT